MGQLNKFTVYPKDSQPFTIECDHFEIKEERFVLYDEAGRNNPYQAHLSFEDVAAIVPELPDTEESSASTLDPDGMITSAPRLIRFRVYLKGKQKREVEVSAHRFHTADSRVVFSRWSIMRLPQPIDEIYIAASEVVAIVPADGLKVRPDFKEKQYS